MKVNKKLLKNGLFIVCIMIGLLLFYDTSVIPSFGVAQITNTKLHQENLNKFCLRPYEDEVHVKAESEKYIISHIERFKHNLQSCNKVENKIRLISVEHIPSRNEASGNLLVGLDYTNEQEKYVVKLNYSYFKNYKPTCYLYHFDKEYNVSEHKKGIKIYNKSVFLAKENFKILVNNFGTYYVECIENETRVYSDVTTILPINMKQFIKEREKFKVKQNYFLHNKIIKKHKMNKSFGQIKNPIKINKRMNVLILGFDSLSYRHFNRILPLTMKFLTGTKHSITYNNFNSIGENTYPNILALLTGILESQSDALGMPLEIEDYLNEDQGFFDKLPFIWNNFESEGYLTMMQEDQPAYSTFNYGKHGFRSRPTAIYGRGFWTKYYSIKTGPWLCHNGIPMFDTFFDFLEQFIDRMNMKENRDIPYFSFNFLTDYTHDDIVVPPSLDLRVSRMLKRFDENGYLDNTLLIIMGDHGHRLSSFAIYSDVGKAEKYRPFLNIKLPKPMWNTNFEKNAKLNVNRLIGMFDLYQTMRHLIQLNKEYIYENEHNLNIHQIPHLRGISIFEQIPVNRSCLDALIPPSQCLCGLEEDIDGNQFYEYTSVTIPELEIILLNEVLDETKRYRHLCVDYIFNKINSIKRKYYSDNYIYTIEFILQPGHSIFTIILSMTSKSDTIEYHRYGRVERTSIYGNQSHCMSNFSLKGFCFCKDLIELE